METTIDYASDYGGEASDYQTTMEGKRETENDYPMQRAHQVDILFI